MVGNIKKIFSFFREKFMLCNYYYEVAVEAFFVGFWSDIAFTALPLVLLVITKYVIGDPVGDIFLSSDFSFVIIILLGIDVGNFITMKVQFQKDISWRLDGGQRMLTASLIIASILLPIIIIFEKSNINIVKNTELIKYINIILTIIAIMFALANAYVRLFIEKMRSGFFPVKVSKKIFSRIMYENINRAKSSVMGLNHAIARRRYLKLVCNQANKSVDWDISLVKDMLKQIELVEENIASLKIKLNEDILQLKQNMP